MLKKLIYLLFVICSGNAFCQTETFKELTKWGIKENDKVIIKPVYDTAFNFDNNGKVCLVCNKAKTPSANRFIRVMSVTYNCNYLDKTGKRLMIIPYGSDTACSIFSLTKQAVKQYTEDPKYIIVSVKGRRFLVTKDFKQITFKEYSEINYTGDPNFLIAEIKNEANVVFKGLIDLNEKEIVPFIYSNIKLNTRDSLIIACSAGMGANREDDIYNYSGKKVDSYRRHIDMATKNYVIHKIFEPKEYYIIYNPKTKEEHVVYSEEVQLHTGEELLMRNDDHWFTYDMITGLKKPFEQKK